MSGIFNTFNYLVPASGTTHGFNFAQVFSATPTVYDFRNESLDGQPFTPSGVYVDNTQGTGPLTITIVESNYNIVCPPGSSIAAQYPAPLAQSVSIVGLGQASVTFVDYPVLPFNLGVGGGTLSAIANGGDVAEGATTDVAAPTDTGTASVIALLKRLNTKEGLGTLPYGATQVSASSGNVANAAAVATLPAVVGKTNYVSGFEITGGGATAAALVAATLAGLLGGTATYIVGAQLGVTVPNNPLIVEFNPPLPASAANIALTLTVPALGAGNTNSACVIHGYVL